MTAKSPSPVDLCPRCGAEFALEFKGEWWETSRRCSECGVAIDRAPMLPSSTDECGYALEDSPVEDRVATTAGLTEIGIPYRWEHGYVLVVPGTAEERVDGLLDGISQDSSDGGATDAGIDDDNDHDGGEEAHAAMETLFVAADRLQQRPRDSAAVVELMEAAAVAAACLPPYGVDRSLWRRVQALASAVVSRLDESDDEAVAADARVLREALREYV
ncbi:MAG TPA: hypothetical protein VGV93_05425 [Acidimicrobiales bacterium]|nr:hypothetical protein [Acidimicrobiales bacterium]